MNEQDVEIRLRQETDPVMMAELGGPRPRADIERAHAGAMVLAAEGNCWPLKVVLDDTDDVAGGVVVFPNNHDGEDFFEIGWMIDTEFQNRGLASEAVRQVIDKARAERRFRQLHAFPSVTNGPSNRICEKNGFVNLGALDYEFAGHHLRCNHWRVDLWADDQPETG